MIDDKFKEWLIKKVKLSSKTASDASSRCRRIEKIFNINLGNAAKSMNGLEKVLERLNTESNAYIKPSVKNRYAAKATLVRATRLYHQFLNSI